MFENIKTASFVIMALAILTQTAVKVANVSNGGTGDIGTSDVNQSLNLPEGHTPPVAELDAPLVEDEPNAEVTKPKLPKTTIIFQESSHDFGDINEGARVNHTFKFTNTGSNPLVIDKASGSCGCTVPSWPKEPIPPGESGDIQIAFNSTGKNGTKTNKVTIEANTDPEKNYLTIKATVLRKDTEPDVN